MTAAPQRALDDAQAPTLAQPLAIVGAEACGSSGLNARALAAAMWSHATRFELIDGAAFGIADVLRVALCPLFDGATPWATRMEGLANCVLQGEAELSWRQAVVKHCICPKAATAARPSAVHHHHSAQSFVDVLHGVAQQLKPRRAGPPPVATLMAVDSLLDAPLLQPLHKLQLLSTEELAQGLIPSEACALLTLAPLGPTVEAPMLATVQGACAVPLGTSPSRALTRAIRGAVGDAANNVHTVLWDIGPDAALLPAIAEAIASLGPLVQAAQFVRPLQYIGGTGVAFAAVATILAIEGCRAGLTTGGRTLICSLSPQTACAVLVEAPWHPSIMLADAPRPHG